MSKLTRVEIDSIAEDSIRLGGRFSENCSHEQCFSIVFTDPNSSVAFLNEYQTKLHKRGIALFESRTRYIKISPKEFSDHFEKYGTMPKQSVEIDIIAVDLEKTKISKIPSLLNLSFPPILEAALERFSEIGDFYFHILTGEVISGIFSHNISHHNEIAELMIKINSQCFGWKMSKSDALNLAENRKFYLGLR